LEVNVFMREALKQARENKGLSQKQLAELASIDRSSYVHIEQGDRNPSLRVATAIARVLSKPIEALFLPFDVLDERGRDSSREGDRP
jgi:putative transcriptional regulator